jgi:hypothetical protein
MHCPECGAELVFALATADEDDPVGRREAWQLAEDEALLREANGGADPS